MPLDRQIIGNVGLYYCCYKLSRLGWNVIPTARNARGMDIVACSGDGETFVGIHVKALSARHAVPLGLTLDKLMGDYWIVINQVAAEPAAFVLLRDEVRELAVRDKGGQKSYWLPSNACEQEQFREAWDRIGSN